MFVTAENGGLPRTALEVLKSGLVANGICPPTLPTVPPLRVQHQPVVPSTGGGVFFLSAPTLGVGGSGSDPKAGAQAYQAPFLVDDEYDSPAEVEDWELDIPDGVLGRSGWPGPSKRSQRRYKNAMWRQKETAAPARMGEGQKVKFQSPGAPGQRFTSSPVSPCTTTALARRRGKPRARSEGKDEGSLSPRNDSRRRRRRRRVGPKLKELLLDGTDEDGVGQEGVTGMELVVDEVVTVVDAKDQDEQQGASGCLLLQDKPLVAVDVVQIEEEEHMAVEEGGLDATGSPASLLHACPEELAKCALAFLPPASLAALSSSAKSGPPTLVNTVAQSLCQDLRASSGCPHGNWVSRLELLHASKEATHPAVADAIDEMVNGKMLLGRLRVVGGNVTDEELQPLCRAIMALPKSCPLQLINLSGNRIGDPGALALAQALSSHTKTLHAICLARNEIGSAGAEALAHLAAHCPRLGVFYLAANPLHRVYGVDYHSAPPDEPSPRLAASPTCVAISEELLMRADARLLASMARRWSASRRYSELLPLVKEYSPPTNTAVAGSDMEEFQLSPTRLTAMHEERDKRARAASESDGVEALIQAVEANHSLTTLSVRATGIAPCFCQKIREAWGDRSATGLYL